MTILYYDSSNDTPVISKSLFQKQSAPKNAYPNVEHPLNRDTRVVHAAFNTATTVP